MTEEESLAAWAKTWADQLRRRKEWEAIKWEAQVLAQMSASGRRRGHGRNGPSLRYEWRPETLRRRDAKSTQRRAQV